MTGWPHRRGPRRHDAVREVPTARQEPVIGAESADHGPTLSDVIHDLTDRGWPIERIADALNTTQSRVRSLLASSQTQPASVPDDQGK
ncbi:hypothetical protein MXD62_26065 [Frankia sp. Mgl5]|uniref:hypothetical protein n=1 Tax=Frankia sp. Mgl5 TaxID=2933793 RepID=UPI00200EDC81|nr:hypothetical protein [Frankia sp. Mgl5]MCK9930589.1 hypothetical protein [Frankia sp. Mgl5]